MSDPNESEIEQQMDKFADHLAGNHAAQSVGGAVMPGFQQNVDKLLADLDAEAAADKAMLDTVAREIGEKGPLEEAGISIDAIRAIDPKFDDAEFIRIARETFLLIRNARTEEAPKLDDALMSHDMEKQLNEAIDGDVASHRHHLLPLLEIQDARIHSAAVSDGKERLVVRLHLAGEELDRDATGAIISGDTTMHQWQENWTFERDPSVDTSVSDEEHILGFSEWMFAHRGWVVTAIERVPATAAAAPPTA